jgi:oligopeptidase B
MNKALALSSLALVVFVAACGTTAKQKEEPAPVEPPKPPIAKRVDKKLTHHGHDRVDPYFWLRDDKRKNPEMLAYLNAENDFTKAVMAETEKSQTVLFDEIVGRIKKDDNSVPVFVDGYWHYTRYEKGKEHPIFCRKKENLDGAEEILLDANVRAKDQAYYRARSVKTARKGDRLAWSEDTVSRRIYKIHLKDLTNGKMFEEVLEGTDGTIAWGDDSDHLFYIKKEKGTLREYQVWRHKVGTPQKDDVLVYEEKDNTFWVQVYRSKSNQYMIIHIGSTLTEEARVLSTKTPEGEFKVFTPRERGHEYQIDHAGDSFYVRSNLNAVNFRLFTVKSSDVGTKDKWREMIPHRQDVLLDNFEVFKDFLVVRERAKANALIRVIPTDKASIGYEIPFEEPAFHTWIDDNPGYETDTLRFGYTSLTTPDSIFDFNMKTKERALKKQDEVLGDFHQDAYVTERIWAKARDGKMIPISLVHRKDLDRKKTQPLYLYGYGSYGMAMPAYFSSPRLSLLDRGFIFAVAHIRGGADLGRPWYEDGKLMKKMNTFTDFIDSAKHLQKLGYTTPAQTVAVGGSAGGLLMGAVANIAPQNFGAIVAQVPFVDVVTTMLDESIPLTTFEYDEWGNPNEEAAYKYMLTYSPYDNVKRQRYPAMLVMTGLHDSQVQYWEPAKWVAKLRHTKLGDDLLLMHTNMETGHSGASGRFKKHKERALEYAFVFKSLGLALPEGPILQSKPKETKPEGKETK